VVRDNCEVNNVPTIRTIFVMALKSGHKILSQHVPK
jgi:hypothetical protein